MKPPELPGPWFSGRMPVRQPRGGLKPSLATRLRPAAICVLVHGARCAELTKEQGLQLWSDPLAEGIHLPWIVGVEILLGPCTIKPSALEKP